MRSLVPAETLVYLETNDLAAALQPIVDAKPFMEVAKSKPDFSALKGVQLAVAVTGFETSEEKLTDEHSVGRVQPRPGLSVGPIRPRVPREGLSARSRRAPLKPFRRPADPP